MNKLINRSIRGLFWVF